MRRNDDPRRLGPDLCRRRLSRTRSPRKEVSPVLGFSRSNFAVISIFRFQPLASANLPVFRDLNPSRFRRHLCHVYPVRHAGSGQEVSHWVFY